MSFDTVDLICGESVRGLLSDQQFVDSWRVLHEASLTATAFQTLGFVQAWYGAYEAQWQPVVVRACDSNGLLTGLWLLAYNPKTCDLVNAGTHQAEYHAWLSVPGRDVTFLTAAWELLRRNFVFSCVRFKYLPNTEMGDLLISAFDEKGGVILRRSSRPLLQLDVDLANTIPAKKSKKSHQSRFNRLNKLGKLEFRRISQPADFERVFDELVTLYDLRQCAVNNTAPFREDVQKRKFHSELFAVAPNEIFFAATYLDDSPIAASWCTVSGKTVHLGLLIFSPLLAKHSPGKIHIFQLSERLFNDGHQVLDLTPGGDAWKEFHANSHDEVVEAMVYCSKWQRRRADTAALFLQIGKQGLARVKITPDHMRSIVGKLRRVKPGSLFRKISNWCLENREYRVYRADREMAKKYQFDERVHCNSFIDLLAFEPGESWQTRQNFLSAALSRVDQGGIVYTVNIGDRLAHSGWMAVNQTVSYMSEVKQSMTFPPASVTFYDFYTHPDFRGQGLYRLTVGHMLKAAFTLEDTEYAYISVLAKNGASRHVIETMGFEYQGSYFWRRHFGKERKWPGSTTVLLESAVA